MLKLSHLETWNWWFQNNVNFLHSCACVPIVDRRFSVGDCVPWVSRRINNSRQFRVTARRNEDRRIPVVFDRNLLAARGRAQRMIHRGALSLFGKYFWGWARAVIPPLVELVRASNGLKRIRARRRDEAGGRWRSANVPIRMSFVFFVSWLVCSTVTRRKEGVPDEYEGRWRSRWRGWRTLIYRGNRSLFLSRRLSRPPHLDRYRLVIGFRYLNISAQWNLSDWIGRIYGKQEASMILNILRVYVLYYVSLSVMHAVYSTV